MCLRISSSEAPVMILYWMCYVDYMLQKLGIDEAKVPELCDSLYKTYGTTMAGLRV